MFTVFFKPAPPPILTPCIGVCTMGPDGLCEGCFRNTDEITRWSSMSNAERQCLMDETLSLREAMRSAGSQTR
jgi:hypothetical protein